MLRLALLLSAVLSLGAAAPTPVRLYRPLTPTARAARADWELFLSKQPSPDGALDSVLVKVELRRRGRKASGPLLLTVSAAARKGKSVSRKQAELELAAGQKADTAVFKLENPGCGPAQVVAALFRDQEPLARAERTMRFECGD